MEIELEQAVGLLDYLGRVAWRDGGEITITKKGKPYLKLVAHPEGRIEDAPQKPIPVDLPGAKVWISPEYFEEDMDIIEAFEGKYSDDSLFEPFLTHPEAGNGKLNDTTGSPQAD